MIKQLGVAEAREQFTRIPEIFEEEIAETLEILADKDFYSEL